MTFDLPSHWDEVKFCSFLAQRAHTPRLNPTTTPAGARRPVLILFATLWHALADILGTAAAATLLRRATQEAAATFPELSALEIRRDTLEYQYKVPAAWSQTGAEPPEGLFLLVAVLWTLLKELTGSVVINHLAQVAELREYGLIPPRETRS